MPKPLPCHEGLMRRKLQPFTRTRLCVLINVKLYGPWHCKRLLVKTAHSCTFICEAKRGLCILHIKRLPYCFQMWSGVWVLEVKCLLYFSSALISPILALTSTAASQFKKSDVCGVVGVWLVWVCPWGV